ncbi:MAG: RluA family pseudouridine synthase [FCB group bacterium]|nr:RluA family pseudouridine synthase [FCB group bacterium]
MPQLSFEDVVGEEYANLRLDVYLTDRLEDASRSYVKKMIKDGRVMVNGEASTKPSRIMNPGDNVTAELPPAPSTHLEPENIPLEILYQDEHIVVVNKASGIAVHPGTGIYNGTLVNALLFHCADFQRPGEDPARPGIVHRLDMFTSGVLVVGKTEAAFRHLALQAREHRFERRYLALVRGEYTEETGRIDAALGRSLSDPTRMTVTGVHGRDAVTNFRVVERFGVASLLAVKLETGRTHQIRVHLRFTGHPVLGDPVYGDTDFSRWPVSTRVRAVLGKLQGQALHAELLGIEHPATGERMEFTAPPPADFQAAVEALRQHIAQ